MIKLPVIALLVCATPAFANADSLYSRNLSCDRWRAARESEICWGLEREMEWTWTGHAILSPSLRVTFRTTKVVYCSLRIRAEDTKSLVNMVIELERKPDSTMARAQALNGARFLLFLLGSQALEQFPTRERDWDDMTRQIAKSLKEEIAMNLADRQMIWHPKNPEYLLRNGCG
jgi:hypothetical protein